jgi:hypothetical protein
MARVSDDSLQAGVRVNPAMGRAHRAANSKSVLQLIDSPRLQSSTTSGGRKCAPMLQPSLLLVLLMLVYHHLLRPKLPLRLRARG